MSLKKQAIYGIKWTTTTSVINSVVQIVQLAILARLLDPTDFGLMALVMAVIEFSQMFIDMGISNAIIYRQKISTQQLSTLYWLNIIIGIFLFILLYIFSPLISRFYEDDNLTPLLILVAATFLIKPWGQQFMVLLQKKLEFDHIAKTDISSRLISFIIVIILAFNNYGVYSLAIGSVVFAFFSTLGYIYFGSKLHKPKMYFKLSDLKDFLSFGLFQMGEKILQYFANQFDTIMIGKVLGMEILGIYNVAKNLVSKPSSIINPVITKVTFPLMSQLSNQVDYIKIVFLKITNLLSYINVPIYFTLLFFAEPVVKIFFGNEWMSTVPLVRIISMTYLLKALVNPSGSLLLSQGKANIAFFWKLSTVILYPTFILIGGYWGIIGIAVSLLLLQFILFFPHWRIIVNRICKIKFWEYTKNMLIPLIYTIVPLIFAKIISFRIINPFWELGIALFAYFIILIPMNFIFNKSKILEFKGLLFK